MVSYKKLSTLSFLILIFCFSLLLRALLFNYYFMHNPIMLAYDSGQYHTIATQLTHGHGFTHLDGSRADYRLPGYPLFLAGCYTLLGVSACLALCVQIVLASLIPVLIFFFVTTWLPGLPWIAYVSAIVALVHPGYMIYANLLMSETLFIFFLLLFFIFLGKCFWHQASNHWLLCSGLALGGASLIRSVGPYMLIVLLCVLFIRFENVRIVIKMFSTITLGWIFVVCWWLVANFCATGYWYFDTLPGVHFLKHGAARIVMRQKNIPYHKALEQLTYQWKEKIEQQEQEEERSLYNVERSRLAQGIVLDTYLKYPVASVWLSMQNMLKTMLALYSSELLAIEHKGILPAYDQSKAFLARVSRYIVPCVQSLFVRLYIWWELFFHMMLMLGFAGFFCLLLYGYRVQNYTEKHKVLIKKSLISSLFYALFVFLSLACGYARFRLPVACFIIMLAVYFWQSLFDMVKREGICNVRLCRKKL